ncbi:MAG: PQQ-binding-like beta-propeller repeat protein, partial [Candidatus Acidiferrum sp.]
MDRTAKIFLLVVQCVFFFIGPPANSQTLKLNWTKEFAKPVSWYVRTSPGILIVKAQNSLTALDGKDGRELWELADVRLDSISVADIPGAEKRGLNVLEVPWMGVLLLNGARLPSSAERRLIALNLMTGERLWDEPPVDEMMTVIPQYESGQIVVVSRRVQKKILVAEAAAATASEVPFLFASGVLPYPYRFELERLDLGTGKIAWNMEYPRTFTPGTTYVSAFANHLFVYFGNRFLGCVDLASGKVLWEDGAKHLWSASLPVPLQMANGRLIYVSKEVQAIDPATEKVAWTIEDLGKVTGIFVYDGLAVAIGEKRIAAVDAESGKERWRVRTHGHTTNLLWEKGTDTLLYMDWKGLHRVKRTAGKSLLDAPLQTDTPPYYLRMAGPASVVAIGYNETDGYEAGSGKLLFTEGKLNALFRSDAFLDDWPLPEDGQEMVRMVREPFGDAEWDSVHQLTLLPAVVLQNLVESATDGGRTLDVYQTEPETGPTKIWWMDEKTNKQMVIRPTAQKHD